MENLTTDLRHALRRLRQNPGFSLVVVLTLALGIGAVTAVFTVVDGVLLEPLPYRDPDRIVEVEAFDLEAPSRPGAFSEALFAGYRDQSTVFAAMAAYRGRSFTLTGEGDPEALWGARVTADYFRVLGRAPILGRAFLPEDDLPGADKVVILEHRLWRDRFGSDPGILGRALTLEGETYTVVGVTPPRFGGQWVKLFVPLATDFAHPNAGRSYLFSRARLQPGVTVERAGSELRSLTGRLIAAYPEQIPETESVRVVPLLDKEVGEARPALLLLHGAVVLLLLIACVNVAGLFSARLVARHREVAVRRALGAGRRRLLGHFLAESLVLAGAGGACGLVLAAWGTRAMLALGDSLVPRPDNVAVDGSVLAFTVLVTLGTGVFFGVVPLRAASRLGLSATLREGSHARTPGRGRLGFALVTVEVALALVLVIGAGLLVRSFVELSTVEPGFDPDRALAAMVELPSRNYGDEPRQLAFFRRLLERASSLPGVDAAALTFPLPLTGGGLYRAFSIAGHRPPPGTFLSAHVSSVSPGFFRTIGVPLRRGRVFTEADHESAEGVLVINESAARHYFAGEDPIGRHVTFNHLELDPEITWWTVVGVVGDVRLNGLDADAPPIFYHSIFQTCYGRAAVVLRAAGDPAALAGPLREELRVLDPGLPLASVRTLRDVVGRSVKRPRSNALLLGVFAGLALVLALLGVYGLLSYSASWRRREVGIRMALGARRGDVVGLLLRQGMAPVVLGLAAGLGLALACHRVIESLLFGVSATDRGTYLGVAALLAAVAAVACWLPARRASRVSPVAVLREE